jgi:hypothetical protein
VPTEHARRHLTDLSGERETLITREQPRKHLHLPQFVAEQHQLLESHTTVGYVDHRLFAGAEPSRALKCRGHRAPPAERPAAIVDSRPEALLESMDDMEPIRKSRAVPCAQHQLDRRLAVGVLQVLAAQAKAVRAQQPSALRDSHDCDLLCRIARPRSARSPHRLGGA